MAKYRKKPIVIEAYQWFENGDHPLDDCKSLSIGGKVVRHYIVTRYDSDACAGCKKRLFDHGWIDTLEGGHLVCPGDYIITGVKGEYYPCKPDIFKMTYEKVDENG